MAGAIVRPATFEVGLRALYSFQLPHFRGEATPEMTLFKTVCQ